MEPVGLAVIDSWIYWADRHQEVIVRVDKTTGTARKIVLSQVSRLSSLTAVSASPQPLVRTNPCLNHKLNDCSHICALRSLTEEGSSVAGFERVCLCPVELVLEKDGRTCGLPGCKEGEFSCIGKGHKGEGMSCIPAKWRCDGEVSFLYIFYIRHIFQVLSCHAMY